MIGRPARSVHEKGRGADSVHLTLVTHPDYEHRTCADNWYSWDGPADGQKPDAWWKERGEVASRACQHCPVFDLCDEWRRSGARVTGVLAGKPVEEGKPVDVRPPAERKKEVAA